jgi:hypothetical protein
MLVRHIKTHIPVLLYSLGINHDELVLFCSIVHAGIKHLFRHGHAASMKVKYYREGLIGFFMVSFRQVNSIPSSFTSVQKLCGLGKSVPC